MITRSAAAPSRVRVLAFDAPERSERGLVSYLALPRPKDMVKWWILPAVFTLAAVGVGRIEAMELLRAGVVWLTLEFLIYQARYQWNDIVGFAADQQHPDRTERGRLPGPASRRRQRKLASASVVLLRLLVAAGLGLVIPALHIELLNLVLMGSVFSIAALYEQLKQRATGWAHEVPPPLRSATAGLWVTVGGGYAIRGVAGLGLVVDLAARPGLALATTAAMWAYGISFVTSRWVVEALAFARVDGGQLAWSCRPEQRREHLLSLVRWLPKYDALAAGPGGLRAWRPLKGPTRLTAPWNAATIASGTCAGLAGFTLTGAARPGFAVGMGMAFALGTFLVLCAPARARVAVLLGSAAAITVLELIIGAHRPLLVVTAWMAAVGAQLWFFSQSLETIARGPQAFRGRFYRA